MALRDAVKVDLKVLARRDLSDDLFLGVGDIMSSGVVEPSSSSSKGIRGCSRAQSSELTTCLILRSELDREAKGEMLLFPPVL